MSDLYKNKQRDMEIRQDKIDVIKTKQGVNDDSEVEIAEIKVYTFKDKLLNFWYYHKIHLLIGALVVGFAIFAISTIGPGVDIPILYLTPSCEVYQNTEAAKDAVKEYAVDVNNDGEINVRIDYCPLTKDNIDLDMDAMNYANHFTKAMAIIKTGDTLLIIADDKVAFEQNLGDSLEDLTKLYPDNDKIGKNGFYFKDTAFADNLGGEALPDNVFIGILKVVENQKYTEDMREKYSYTLPMLQKIIEEMS